MLALLLVSWLALEPQQPGTAAHGDAVVKQLAAGSYADVVAQSTDAVRAQLTVERLAAIWASLVSQAGAFKEITHTREQTLGTMNIAVVTCAFERATLDFQITFDAEWRVAGFFIRPPTPAVPYSWPSYVTTTSFTESAVTVGAGDWEVPGTVTLPNGPGPFPVVILVHGSGPNDRDETVAGSKPFKDLAGGLASRGVAVLRYDKRTKVHGSRMAGITDLTVKQEVIDDVIAAVAVARTHPGIDPKQVFVLGHSLGGMLIPRIGAADPTLAGFIVMAGAARAIEDAIVEQTRYLAMADGSIAPDEQKQIDEMAKLQADVRALTPADATAGKRLFNAPASYWLDLRGYDPPAAATALKQPILVLQGGRDYQVTPDEFARWKQALASKRNATFHLYPTLNHLFVTGEGKSLPAEYVKGGHVDAQVVDDVATWVKSVSR